MNILVQIDFVSGTQYFAKQNIIVSGNQYKDYIISAGNISQNMDIDPSYQTSGIEIIFQDDADNNRHFRQIVNDLTNGYIIGKDIRVYNESGTLWHTFKLESYQFLQGQFSITATDKTSFIDVDITTKIDDAIFTSPLAVNSIGQVIPKAYNTCVVKAWKVFYTSIRNYHLGTAPVSVITDVKIGGETINASYWNPTPLVSSIGGVNHYFLRMEHGVIALKGDYAFVTCTGPAKTPVEVITDLLSGYVTVDTNAAFSTYLSGLGHSSTTFSYVLEEEKTAKDILEEFCHDFGCLYYFDSQNKVQFTFFDNSSIALPETFQPGKIISMIPASEDYSQSTITNDITYYWNYDNETEKFVSSDVYRDTDSISKYGSYKSELYLYFVDGSTVALDTVTRRAVLRRAPLGRWSCQLTSDMMDFFTPGQFIRFSHPDASTKYPVYYRVVRITKNTEQDIVELELVQYNYLSVSFPILAEDGMPILTEDGSPILYEGAYL